MLFKWYLILHGIGFIFFDLHFICSSQRLRSRLTFFGLLSFSSALLFVVQFLFENRCLVRQPDCISLTFLLHFFSQKKSQFSVLASVYFVASARIVIVFGFVFKNQPRAFAHERWSGKRACIISAPMVLQLQRFFGGKRFASGLRGKCKSLETSNAKAIIAVMVFFNYFFTFNMMVVTRI